MTERTNEQKLDGAIFEFTTLLPRVTSEYRPSMQTCIDWLKEVKADIAEQPDAEATDEETQPELTITCESDFELDTICNVIQAAEEEGEIDFGFQVKRS